MINLGKTLLLQCFVMLLLLNTGATLAAAEHVEIPEKSNPNIVFLISEDPDNYDAHLTIPVFAEQLRQQLGYNVTIIKAEGERHASFFPGLEILKKADLVVVFARRLALPKKQMNLLKKYLKKGGPLVGIRTANHAFSIREGEIPDTHQDWPDFVPEYLGCDNRGYGPVGPGIDVEVVSAETDQAVLQNIGLDNWHSEGNLYLVAPLLDQDAIVLLEGKSDGLSEPIAWTRMKGKSRIFYTSLGYPTDFKEPKFQQLLINGVNWALNK